jgi:branched-chain amino acid transport system substrate-binding protein
MRHTLRLGRVVAVFAVVLLVATACVKDTQETTTGGGSSSRGGGVVKIGLIGPFSGIAASVGRNMREGVEIAVDELNAKGGVNGNQIEVVARDDEFDPAKDAQVARELIEQEHVSAIIGPAGATNYLAISQLIQQAHVIDMPIVTDPILRQQINPYAFRIMIPDDIEINLLADYAMKRFSTIAMIAEDDQTGKDQVKLTEAELQKHGRNLVDTELFSVDDLDLTPLVLKLQRSGADAVVIGSHIGPYAARVLTAADALGYQPQWLGLAGLTSYTLADLARDNVVGLIFVAPANPVLVGGNVPPNAQHFYNEYVQKFFPDGVRSEAGANKVIGAAFLTYDGVKMWAQAAEQAGSSDADQVQRVFNAGFTFGPADSSADLTWHYSATDHEGFHQQGAWFYQWVKDSHGIEFKFIGDAAKLVG